MKIKSILDKKSIFAIATLILATGINQACEPTKLEDGIRIIDNFYPESHGLEQDAKIFEKYFGENGISVYKEQIPTKTAYVNLFLQEVSPEYAPYAKYNWFMVNQETVTSVEPLRCIDLVICKTKHAEDLMKQLKEKHGLKYDIVYTRFTSLVKRDNKPKDYNLYLHSAQKSPYKNTGAVVNCWKRNPHFPLLKGTCFGHCREYELTPFGHTNLNGYSNISLAEELLPWEEYKELRATAGVHVVPSSIEGYGHQINEARANGAVLITTDAPPMNELAENDVSGFLVASNGSRLFTKVTGARSYSFDPDTLAQVVENIRRKSPEQLQEIAHAGRLRFVEDTQFFQEKIAELSSQLRLESGKQS